MKIGIDGSRAFIKKRTGIEEYSYQIIRHLTLFLTDQEVILYIRSDQEVDFEIPDNWKIKKLWFPRFWTQIRLSWELFRRPVDLLFVPAHTVPFRHPAKTVVVIHGLEYEFYPQAYSLLERIYMRFVIKNSCRWASDVVCVSQNTKKDVMNLYGIDENKIKVILEGYSGRDVKNKNLKSNFDFEAKKIKSNFLLFVGRIEERKNVEGIVKAFDIYRKKYGVDCSLVLAGKPGYGYAKIKKRIEKSPFKEDIIELGYISDEEKWEILAAAKMFLFPTFYEGFGLPVLEAQNAMVPVIISNVSSLPQISGGAALQVDPRDSALIAENINILMKNESARENLIRDGLGNIKKFSWIDSAREVSFLLKEK